MIHFLLLKVFSSDTPLSLKRQKKGPKEHDGSKKANQKNASTVYDIMH